MIRRYMAPLKALLVLSDAVTAIAVFVLLVWFRYEILEPDATWDLGQIQPFELAIAYGILWVTSLWFFGLYRLRTHWTLRGELVDVVRATILGMLVSLSALYVLKLADVSRLFLAMLWIAQPSVTLLSRVVLRSVLSRVRSAGRMRRFALVIGAGPEAQQFATEVERHRELGLYVIGHLAAPHDPASAVSRPVLGSTDDIETVLHGTVVDEVVVCLSPRHWELVEPVTRICEEVGKIVRVSVPALDGVLASGAHEEFGRLSVMTFVYGPDRLVSMALKRAFDIVASALGLLALSPLLVGIASYIRLADGSPVFFRHRRVGLHGRPFDCLKFRTMVLDAEARHDELEGLSNIRGPAFKMHNDPRITRVGRRLRRWSLDELPQLINVLRGEMSIVGPRPAPPREVSGYSIWHRRRLSMKPGITGLWQVAARNDDDFDRRADLDLMYIDRWSIWLDLRILLRTLPSLVSQGGR
jgi:exopolysaccharide biosynthesis polyprenyl glycosylphosphotransferase